MKEKLGRVGEIVNELNHFEKYCQPATKYQDYDDWLRWDVFASCRQCPEDEYKHFDDWLNWSRMTAFDENECYDKWDSFGKSDNPENLEVSTKLPNKIILTFSKNHQK